MATTDGNVATETDWSAYSSQSLFLDANALVHSTISASPFHLVARDTLDALRAAGAKLQVSLQILREYISATTKPPLAKKPPDRAPVIANVRQFLTDFTVLADGLPVVDKLLDLLATIPCGGKQVHDANIVATMLVHGVPNLLTHNVADFKRFGHLINIIPLVP